MNATRQQLIYALLLLCGACATRLPGEYRGPLPVEPSPQILLSPECIALGRPELTPETAPKMPRSAQKADQEGWVMFQYDVVEGKVVNPVLQASSPPGVFERSVMQWAATLRYPSGKSALSCQLLYSFVLE